jgi:hypothetical protein
MEDTIEIGSILAHVAASWPRHVTELHLNQIAYWLVSQFLRFCTPECSGALRPAIPDPSHHTGMGPELGLNPVLHALYPIVQPQTPNIIRSESGTVTRR